jgi:ribosome biogenesis protein Nip4
MANETIRYEDLYDASLEAGIKRLQKESDTLYESFKKTLLLQNELKIVTKDSANSSKELAAAQSNLLRIEKENEKLKQKLISIEQKKAQETNKLTIEYQKQALEQRKQIELLKAQAQVQTSASNTEQRAQAIIKLLTIEKAKLNQETENGRKRLDAYNRAIDIQRNKLLSTGSVIQKQAMNVGNYAYNQNALNLSFAQLTREMPAFANSIQTGFMALSNNIPMFIDQVQAAKRGIQQMTAEGQKAPSMFSVLAKSIFSFQSLISLGVTALTIYGAKIVEFFTSSKKETNEFVKVLETASSKITAEIIKMAAQKGKVSLSDIFTVDNKSVEELEKQVNEIKKVVDIAVQNVNIPVSSQKFLDNIIQTQEEVIFWEKEVQKARSKGVLAYQGLTNDQFQAYLELRKLTFEHNKKLQELEIEKQKKEKKTKEDAYLKMLEIERDYQAAILEIQGQYALDQFDNLEKSEKAIIDYKLKMAIINEREYQTALAKLYKERADFVEKLESEALKSATPQSGLKPTSTINTKATPYTPYLGDHMNKETLLERLALDKESLDAVKTATQQLEDILSEHFDNEVKIAKKRVDNADRELENAKTNLEKQYMLKEQGYASNIMLAEKEFNDAKRIQKRALEEERKALRQQQIMQGIEQSVNLVSASAAVIKKVGADKPYVYLPLIGAMWTAFIATKVRASRETRQEFSEGGTDVFDGGTHASGNDTYFGKRNGKKMFAQKGERWAIFNDKATALYGDNLKNWIKQINNREFQQGGNLFVHYSMNTHNLEKGVGKIVKNTEHKIYQINGKTVEKRGINTTYYV